MLILFMICILELLLHMWWLIVIVNNCRDGKMKVKDKRFLSEKHDRANAARTKRDTRLKERERRKALRESRYISSIVH